MSWGGYGRLYRRNVDIHTQVGGEWYAYAMKQPSFTNLAVFVIFFGIALIEAVQKQNWLEAGLFLALGVLSLRADFSKKQ